MEIRGGKDAFDTAAEHDQPYSPELVASVYDDMRRLAAAYLAREREGHAPRRTSLVHEVYLRLTKRRDVGVSGRDELMGLAAHLIRRILVDRARYRNRLKRQAPEAYSGNANPFGGPARATDLVALDAALRELEKLDPRQSKIVELRYFAELSVEETAEAMGISDRTVKREWAVARAWLHGKLKGKSA